MIKKIISILLSAVLYSAFSAELNYSRSEERPDFNVLRNRTAEKAYLFAQIQSYRLVENYLHYWIDRPLFHDSGLRKGQSYRDSFLRNVEILKDYEIDGFTTLSNALIMYGHHLQALDEVKPYPEFRYLCGAMYASDYSPSKPDEKWNERYVKSYNMAENSPYSLKINGKIPVWAYNSQLLKPEEIKRISEMLQSKSSTEAILFAELNDAKFQALYYQNGKLNDSQMAQLRKTTEALLNECGGLIIKPVANIVDHKADYPSKPSASGYYRNCLAPLLLELLKQPRYREKMIGAYVSKGYINHLSGNNSGEYGTHRFRLFMDELLLLNPDITVLFEWNEANENTHFQPTVSDAKTMQRLVKFYARKMRGQPPAPNPDDDRSVPNLVFSSRQVLRLGDTLRYELLNIPDSDSEAISRVQLTLRDYDGNVLKEFPEETFNTAEMKAVSLEIPTEQLAGHTLILPELRVINPEGLEQTFAMQYNRIHPSVCWNYKEIMQPLRDMLPLRAEFEVRATAAPGVYEVAARAESPEPLLQLEVTDNESEVFAIDRENRYAPERNIIIQGSLTAFSISTRNVVFEVLNAPGWQWFRDCYRAKPDTPDPQVIDNKVTVPDYFIHFYYSYPFIITVPKSAAADAVLTIDIARLGKHSFNVAELLKLGKIAKAFDGNNRLDLSIVKNLVDIPVPLLQEQAEFKTELETESRFPVYQLRALGSSGRIYRGRPFMPVRPNGEAVKHQVFSAGKQQAVEVEVAADRIPELNYLFDETRGAMLKNSWEPFFDAQLGGGFTYLEPFNRPRPNLLAIPGRKFLHPAWKDGESGGKVLEFDGMANYINLPREALPYGSFTLEFEIKPDGNDSQVLFRNFSTHRGSLNLYRRQGKLEASYTYRLSGINNPGGIENFKTELPLPAEEWSKVTVSYNLKELKFTVNGEVRRYPFSGRGVFFKPSVFGGHVIPVHETGKDARFFKGQLKSLRIRHLAE
jgi:hypothetical protein